MLGVYCPVGCQEKFAALATAFKIVGLPIQITGGFADAVTGTGVTVIVMDAFVFPQEFVPVTE
jgi:hypothetical protein